MVKGKKFHQAFRINYEHIVRELITDSAIRLPEVLAGEKESPWIEVKAVWETGATHTVITGKIVRLLDLKPTGKATVFGINSQEIVNRYIVDIELPNKTILSNFEVLESELNSPGIDLLVGMDVIQSGDFVISNANGKTNLTKSLLSRHYPLLVI